MDDRRDRFRRQLALLEGAGDPAAAIDAGLYVARPTSSERMIRRIELEPRATRVITGPIGSGKSTELIVISRALSQTDELWPVYIDVSRVHDLAELREGSLIAAAGVWLSEREHIDNKPLQQLPCSNRIRRLSPSTFSNGWYCSGPGRKRALAMSDPLLRLQARTLSRQALVLEGVCTGKDLETQLRRRLIRATREGLLVGNCTHLIWSRKRPSQGPMASPGT